MPVLPLAQSGRCVHGVSTSFVRSKAPCSRLVQLIPLCSPHSKGVLERAKFGHIIKGGFCLVTFFSSLKYQNLEEIKQNLNLEKSLLLNYFIFYILGRNTCVPLAA